MNGVEILEHMKYRCMIQQENPTFEVILSFSSSPSFPLSSHVSIARTRPRRGPQSATLCRRWGKPEVISNGGGRPAAHSLLHFLLFLSFFMHFCSGCDQQKEDGKKNQKRLVARKPRLVSGCAKFTELPLHICSAYILDCS